MLYTPVDKLNHKQQLKRGKKRDKIARKISDVVYKANVKLGAGPLAGDARDWTYKKAHKVMRKVLKYKKGGRVC